jgi:hypothetical protein
MATIPRQMMGLPNSPSFRYKALNPAYQSDPRRILGQSLMTQGSSSAPVATPLQGLGRLSSALVGAYLQKGAVDRQVAREDAYKDSLTQALSGIDMSKTPFLQSIAQFNPEGALNLGGQLEIKRATTKPTETFRTLTNEEAVAQNLPVDRGQVYQIGSVGKQIKPIGSTTGASMGTSVAQLNRAIELTNKETLTGPESQELRGLKALLKKDTRINTINPTTGNTESIVLPGVDIENILTGIETKTDVKDDPKITKQAKLSEKESSFISDAASAANDIKTVVDIMFNGDLQSGEYNQIVSIGAGTRTGRAASGDAQRLYNAIQNLVDLRLRKRTGATANQSEIDLYQSQVLPGFTTRDSTARANVERLLVELSANIKAFKQGRNVKGLPDIDLDSFLEKSDNKTKKSNLINLPD